MINTRKLKGRLCELGMTQKDIARALNIAPPTVSQKFNGVRPMTLKEAEIIAATLEISDDQFGQYFFKR